MPEGRGRPLVWFGLVVVLWVGARFAGIGPEPLVNGRGSKAAAQIAHGAARSASSQTAKSSRSMSAFRNAFFASPSRKSPGFTPALDPWQDGGRPSGLLVPFRVVQDSKPLSTGRDTPPTNALAPPGKAGAPDIKRPWGVEVYAYSFWRLAANSRGALAPGAQYGGSQSGIIATVDPFGQPDRGVRLLARIAATPDQNDRELALGLRWKPRADWPVQLSAERRFRADAPDRFAVYMSGGVDALTVTGQWRLDAYGSAGYADGPDGGAFFDAQSRLTHSLGQPVGVPMEIGMGGWAGGQRGSKRLDVGPTATAKVDVGPVLLLVQLDWRLRVAGNAAPKDGLALTVSTSF